MSGALPPPSAAPALVGRARERAALRQALAAALAGRGALVLIGGEAGIGKTALAEWLLAEAATHGALVLVGRCYDLAETPPYGPWVEALARAPRADDLPPPPDFAGGGAASQTSLFAAARGYLAVLAARRPVALLLEDLHWADHASLDLLRALGRGLADLPLLLLATYRDDELTRRHPLYALLPTLEREARAARLDLRPLDAAALRALAGRYALPDADAARLAAWLLARAEGNPFFTVQLLRALQEEGVLAATASGWALGDFAAVGLPTPLRQVLDARLARLGAEALHLLTLAAVIGQAAPLALWATVAEADEDGLLDTIDAAGEAHLVAVAPDGAEVRFTHALIREALYEGLAATRRRRIHRLTAEALAALPAPDPDAVANHFQRAGDPRAAAWLVRAGERARHAYAWMTAAARYEAALGLLERQGGDARARGWLTMQLAALRRWGDAWRALDDAAQAECLAAEAGDRLLAGLATFLRGMLLGGFLGHFRQGLPLMEAGLAALAALPAAARVPPGAIAPIDPAAQWGDVVTHRAWSGRFAEALALGERYLAEVTAPTGADWLGGNPHADVHIALGLAHMALGDAGRARAALERAQALARAVGHHSLAALAAAHEWAVAEHYHADRPAALRQLAAEAAAVQARLRGVSAETMPQWIGQGLVLTRDWAAVRQTAEEVRGTWWPGVFPYAEASVALTALSRAQGDAARARTLVAEALPDGPATAPGDSYFVPAVATIALAAALALDAGDLPEASAWLAAHDRWLAWSGAVLWRAEGQLGWAAYHRATGELAAARAHAEAALAHASEPRQPLALLAAHRALGELATADRRHAAAVAHLDAALALADACAAPYERALTLLALAELRAATGARATAGAPLAEARALLVPLTARPALARAAALAARLRTPAPPGPARPFGLTAREAEVLTLLAAGLTDHQIGARLFVSRNTVASHTRAIYGKLGVTSRAAAARLAAEHHLA